MQSNYTQKQNNSPDSTAEQSLKPK